MGALGWAHTDVDEMEVPEVARYLGIGRKEPVAAGSRGIALPSDQRGGGRGGRGSGAADFSDSRVADRRAELIARRRAAKEDP